MRPFSILCDIDGILLKHFGPDKLSSYEPILLAGVVEKFAEWDSKGYKIILTTGRKPSWRKKTEKQLRSVGLFWDRIIFGLGGGKRFLINDFKPNSKEPTAIAINLDRDVGLADVDLDRAVEKQAKIND